MTNYRKSILQMKLNETRRDADGLSQHAVGGFSGCSGANDVPDVGILCAKVRALPSKNLTPKSPSAIPLTFGNCISSCAPIETTARSVKRAIPQMSC